MFDFLKKKSSLELFLDMDNISFGGKITGKVVVKPNSDFTSKSMNVVFNWTKLGVFYNEKPFIKNIQGQTQYYANDVKEVSFDIDFISIQELELWYNENAKGAVKQSEEEANHNAFIDEIKQPWTIGVEFDAPGINPNINKEINII